MVAIAGLSIAALVAFTIGWRYRITAPIAALGVLWTLSYRNAWGMVFHTENLLVLHVLALAVAPAADAWAVDRRQALVAAPADRAPPAGHGWAIRLLIALTVATYVLAGIAKLRLAGALWLDGEQLRNQIAVDNLRKALVGGAIAPLGGWIVAHPRPLAVLSIATLALELGAPLALVVPRLRLAWAGAVWAFHLGVILTMNVWFIYPLSGVAFLPLFEAERVVGYLRDRLGMRRAPPR